MKGPTVAKVDELRRWVEKVNRLRGREGLTPVKDLRVTNVCIGGGSVVWFDGDSFQCALSFLSRFQQEPRALFKRYLVC